MTGAGRLLVERQDDVLVLTLNRPHVANAVDAALAGEISIALDRAEESAQTRGIVLTGAGPTFCAGADLRRMAAGELALAAGREGSGFAGFVRRRSRVPVVAALNGGAVGGGAELALACDAVVAVDSSFLSFPELQRGLLPVGGGLVRVARALPAAVATELLLTGRRMTAEEALRWGLVNQVSSAADLIGDAVALVRRLAIGAPAAVATGLRLLHQLRDEEQGWTLVEQEAQQLRRSPETAAGVRAFLEGCRSDEQATTEVV